ncbi:hypothetical protein [Tianweitania sediminis]|uniref:Uncharacterized protein n=1 Tax=Tianweitania sediminis TaxID=1502156 RepID=A0A8J7ULQ1_9HYPH|nr:hypothetical protein [Tianweitania sediminis]MBP0439612.1 hypothetical protein [Tianweitania sediminis]
MIQIRSAEPAAKPVRASAAQPSDEAIVNGLAGIIDRLRFNDRLVDVDMLFLEGEGDFTRAEIIRHLDAARDRAIEDRRAREAESRVA